MSQEKIKIPIKGGIDEARRRLKELRKKEPSPELVKIIEEVTHKDSEKNPEIGSDDIAAKPKNRDLDL